ncbi:MAG TPA: hypothetical protein VFF02_10360 [Anaeromyxobacteraceae bacterium]|nr:hypothetical protein [Anaeromyxobacteraceae bacterium]
MAEPTQLPPAPPPAPSPAPPAAAASGETAAKVVYVLYLATFVTGVTALVGVVMAYVYRDDAPDWLKTHFRFQIRTFWLGLVFGLVGALLSLVVVGFLVLVFLAVWLVVRCVKGLKYVGRREPYPDPVGWWF